MQSENDGNEDGDIGGAGDGSDGDSDGNANPEDNGFFFDNIDSHLSVRL